jgi:2-polyprenyl-6-methoxyphenol hydroxylase-like FAD-dependent oxidoreductase
VLAIDRDAYGSDTLSSHALMRGAVSQLDRWGILPGLRAATPAIDKVMFQYGENRFTVDVTNKGRAEPLIAPRRTVLDSSLVDAARDAGAEVRHNTRLVSIDQDRDDRVTGLVVEAADGTRRGISAGLVVGADGLRSTVARQLAVPVTRPGTQTSAYMIRYFDDVRLGRNSYRWLYRAGCGAGIIPTTDGQTCVFVGIPPARFRAEARGDVEGTFDRVLSHIDAELAAEIRRARPAGPMRSWPGHAGQFRKAFGPGWALVGDAGYFKDPYSAHGISDAFRDVELLAEAVVSGDFAGYEATRDRMSVPMFDLVERIASYNWDLDTLPGIHMELSNVMRAEQNELAAMRSGFTKNRAEPVAA